MSLKFKTRIKIKSDTKMWDRMERRLRAGNKAIQTGWWGREAQKAAWNEEGHMNGGMFAGTYTPPRPFIRMGFMPEAKRDLTKYFPDIHLIAIGRNTWGNLYRKMAEDYVTLMQETILKWNKPPNSPVTISMKGFNDPLIETGNMYDAVKSKIVRRSV